MTTGADTSFVRRWTLVSILSVLCILTLWVISRAFDVESDFVPKQAGRFDRGEWLALGRSRRNLAERQTMLDELRAQHLRLGMTALEVDELLGHPERRSGDAS